MVEMTPPTPPVSVWREHPLLCLYFVTFLLAPTLQDSKHALSGLGIDRKSENLTTPHPKIDTFNEIIDDYTVNVIIIAYYSVIGTLLNVFGMVNNTISIMVFIKQGLGDSINISLLGLSISDFASLITLQWANICLMPSMAQSKTLPFSSVDVSYLTAGWPRMGFTRITAWITAFITFERCLCITMPLKVKMIITPKRTRIIIISIFIIFIGTIIPTYYTSRLSWVFSPERNRTILSLTFTPDRQIVDSINFIISNVFLTMLAFLIVLVCTVILAVKLRSKTKWRQKSTSNSEQTSNKDNKIVLMVSFLSGIFIICFLPNALIFLAMFYEPQFNIDGLYRNAFISAFAIVFIFESINSSVNIFVYLKMSSKFRETFNQIFSISTGKTK